MKKQKLMILGASSFQMGVIKKAIELNAETIVLSNNEKDPGFKLADKSYLCSTVELEKVLEIAKKEKIDGVMTAASEVAAVTVGYIADQLNLEGYSFSTARTIADKYRLRQFLKENQLPHPGFGSACDVEKAIEIFRTLDKPVMVKPTTGSGSRGVFEVHTERELEEITQKSIDSSILNREIIVEEFLQGFEIGGEVLIQDGKIVFMAPTKKYVNESHVPFGHLLPAGLDEETAANIHELLETVIGLLGMRNGPLNFDIMVNHKKPFIIELGGRIGGNCLPDLMKYHTGTDTVRMTVEMALGRTPDTPVRHEKNPVAAFIIGSHKTGCLKRIRSFEDAKPAGTRHIESHMKAQPGDSVNPFTQGREQLGYHIFTADESWEIEKAMEEMQQTTWIEFEE